MITRISVGTSWARAESSAWRIYWAQLYAGIITETNISFILFFPTSFFKTRWIPASKALPLSAVFKDLSCEILYHKSHFLTRAQVCNNYLFFFHFSRLFGYSSKFLRQKSATNGLQFSSLPGLSTFKSAPHPVDFHASVIVGGQNHAVCPPQKASVGIVPYSSNT